MKKSGMLFIICLFIAGQTSAQMDQEPTKNRWTTAYSAGMMNAALGNLAKEKAVSQLVKDLGSREAQEHMLANEKLKAAVKNPMPLTMDDKHKLKIDRITNKDTDNFDKDYLDTLIKNHEEELKDFEEALEAVKDAELRNWLMSQIPMLKKHLEEAREIKEKV